MSYDYEFKSEYLLESLDELQALVVKSFKDVPNKNLPKLKYPPDPFGEISRKVSYH